MKKYLLPLLVSILATFAHAEDRTAGEKTVSLWYEAFDRKNPALLDKIIDENWTDIPSPAGTPAGPVGIRRTYAQLIGTFPDLRITIKEILRDGDKFVVRSEITGTQRQAFLGIPATNRRMTIQAVDIHEIKDGRIVRTWHTEDWMTGLHQLGILGK
jgi:steroid delta-isomerase-like uncharacterized protein